MDEVTDEDRIDEKGACMCSRIGVASTSTEGSSTIEEKIFVFMVDVGWDQWGNEVLVLLDQGGRFLDIYTQTIYIKDKQTSCLENLKRPSIMIFMNNGVVSWEDETG